MKLARYQVRKFRNVIDSGPIEVDGDVTCLVGMNEAGKTTMLTALNRLNPADDTVFDIQDDYPRWLLIPDRRANIIDTTTPIEATFVLDENDQAAVDSVLGSGVIRAGDSIVVKRSYGDPALEWDIPFKSGAAVANLIASADVAPDLAQALSAADDFPALIAAIKAKQAEEAEREVGDLARNEDLERLLTRTARVTGDGSETFDVVYDALAPRLPTFFYFSNYSVLEGRINLSALSMEANQRAGSTSAQTARSLLRLADTTPEQMTGDDYEDRRAELEAVGNDLTRQVFDYWKQNSNLRVRFDVDRVVNPNPNYGNPPTITSFLDIRVEDVRHNFTNNFSQRSSGFKWFFSFLAAFTEFELRAENFVILLDEPGLTLHGRAQADFLHFINARLSSAAQVLYTTHSPFMVETDKMERVRIVEDGGPDTGATVSQEVLRVGQDSLFPLQAALGYDVVQHLFIGDANLLVEGPSDFIYLDTLSRFLAARKMAHLDPDWRIMPAGGANNIPSFIALIGKTLEVSVLIDAGTDGAQRLQRAMTAGCLKRNRLIEVGEITNSPNSDIEDLFEPDDYLIIYNTAFKRKTTVGSLRPGDRIVKRIEQKLGDKFDHYKPAETLLRDQATLLPQMSEATLKRFAALFGRINASRK